MPKAQCGFCGSLTRKITNEHIFGEWVGRLFAGKVMKHSIGANWRDTHKMVRIWPPSRFADIDPRGLVWPPVISVNEEGFHQLHERFAPLGAKGTRDGISGLV
jgi:hypothetical protein